MPPKKSKKKPITSQVIPSTMKKKMTRGDANILLYHDITDPSSFDTTYKKKLEKMSPATVRLVCRLNNIPYRSGSKEDLIIRIQNRVAKLKYKSRCQGGFVKCSKCLTCKRLKDKYRNITQFIEQYS